MKLSELDYQDRAAAMNGEAVPAEIARLTTLYAAFGLAASDLEKNAVAGINTAREIGLLLQSWCQRETMGKSFWSQHCQSQLPFDYDTAGFFMGVARKLPKKVKAIAEVSAFIQPMLAAEGLLELPERESAQHAVAVGLFQRVLAEFTLIRQPFTKILNERPMEQWGKTQLRDFVGATEWLVTERQRAEKLLKA